MQSRFVLVIVIGYGKTAGDVLRYVAQRQSVFGFRTLCVEHELHGMSQLRAVCEKIGVDYKLIIDKSKLTELLLAVKESTLIISAGNNYLFPELGDL